MRAVFQNNLKHRPFGAVRAALSANMDETVTPLKFSVEGESGSERDERIGAGPREDGDRGRGQSEATAVHGGGQAEDRGRRRRVHDAGRDRGVAATRGAVFLAPDDVARGARTRRARRGAEEAGPGATGRGSARQEAGRAGTGTDPMEEARRAGRGADRTAKTSGGVAGNAAGRRALVMATVS